MRRMNPDFRSVSAIGLASAALTALTLYSAATWSAPSAGQDAAIPLDAAGSQAEAQLADPRLLAQQGRGPGWGGGYGPGGGQGRGMGMGRGMGPGGGMGRNMANFGAFDRDKDGTVTETEFDEARAARIQERAQQGYRMRNLANAPSFQAMDMNHDGGVDAREFAAGHAARRQQMMQPPMTTQPRP